MLFLVPLVEKAKLPYGSNVHGLHPPPHVTGCHIVELERIGNASDNIYTINTPYIRLIVFSISDEKYVFIIQREPHYLKPNILRV